jgi:hypothetical protein
MRCSNRLWIQRICGIFALPMAIPIYVACKLISLLPARLFILDPLKANPAARVRDEVMLYEHGTGTRARFPACAGYSSGSALSHPSVVAMNSVALRILDPAWLRRSWYAGLHEGIDAV